MRNDIRIDRKQVRCPNASTLAYGKWRAQFGDWITWTDEQRLAEYNGRMIGRVAYDPEGKCTGWLIVLTLDMELTSTFERWVNPSWVTNVHANTPDVARFLAWFAGDLRQDTAYYRELTEYGAGKANQNADQPSWDCAEGLIRFDEYLTRKRNAS